MTFSLQYGNTALIKASKCECVKDKGAEVNQQDKVGAVQDQSSVC